MSPGPPKSAEASAPCRVELAGGVTDVLTLTVAIDRRAWCRVEEAEGGVFLESKDALRKASAATVAELFGPGPLGALARLLRATGVEAGVRVVTQSRVPEGSFLGETEALAAAVAGAALRWQGREAGADDVARIAAGADGPGGDSTLREAHTAVRGGVLALHPVERGVRPEALSVDPARVEEALLLVQPAAPPGAGPVDPGHLQDLAGRLLAALVAGRLEDVVSLWREEWEARRGPGWPSREAETVAELVRAAGGATRPCGGGQGGLLAVWAPPGSRGPGRREAVLAAAREAGLRLFPARVDLRGLEVE